MIKEEALAILGLGESKLDQSTIRAAFFKQFRKIDYQKKIDKPALTEAYNRLISNVFETNVNYESIVDKLQYTFDKASRTEYAAKQHYLFFHELIEENGGVCLPDAYYIGRLVDAPNGQVWKSYNGKVWETSFNDIIMTVKNATEVNSASIGTNAKDIFFIIYGTERNARKIRLVGIDFGQYYIELPTPTSLAQLEHDMAYIWLKWHYVDGIDQERNANLLNYLTRFTNACRSRDLKQTQSLLEQVPSELSDSFLDKKYKDRLYNELLYSFSYPKLRGELKDRWTNYERYPARAHAIDELLQLLNHMANFELFLNLDLTTLLATKLDKIKSPLELVIKKLIEPPKKSFFSFLQKQSLAEAIIYTLLHDYLQHAKEFKAQGLNPSIISTIP